MKRSKHALAFAMALACITAVPASTATMITTTVCAAENAVSEDVLNEIGEAAIAAAKKVKDDGGSADDITNAAIETVVNMAIDAGITDPGSVASLAGKAAGMNGGDGQAAGQATAKAIAAGKKIETDGENAEGEKTEEVKEKKPHVINPNVSADYAKSPLFEQGKVHEINLTIKDENWEKVVTAAANQEKKWGDCDVSIDGETVSNVAIRGKGNASLRSVSKMEAPYNERYGYKIEFDHNDGTSTYHGLDKISLSSLGQDYSCMKDFMTYTMMNDMGVHAPLCSYAVLKVNGKDLGLYLVSEAVEDGFIARNYKGDLSVDVYKPESISHANRQGMTPVYKLIEIMNGKLYHDVPQNKRIDIFNDVWGGVYTETGFTYEFNTVACQRWAGDSVDAYNDIWEESVFDCTDEDKTRLVSSLNTLNNGSSVKEKESVLDMDQLMRYFAVHMFTNNNDSLTGVQKHNYYLVDNNGKLSYVPWDYNTAYGGMQFEIAIRDIFDDTMCLDMDPTERLFDTTGKYTNLMPTEKNLINYPIDEPIYTGGNASVPMLGTWLDTEEGKEAYHKIYDEFIKKFESGRYEKLWQATHDMLKPYVEKNLTFYTPEQFEDGAKQMQLYLKYRSEAIRKQLDGEIPSTIKGQEDEYDKLLEPVGMELYKMSTANGTTSAPSTEDFINPMIKAYLGDDPDYSVGHFTDVVIDTMEHPEHMDDAMLARIKEQGPLQGIYQAAMKAQGKDPDAVATESSETTNDSEQATDNKNIIVAEKESTPSKGVVAAIIIGIMAVGVGAGTAYGIKKSKK